MGCIIHQVMVINYMADINNVSYSLLLSNTHNYPYFKILVII